LLDTGQMVDMMRHPFAHRQRVPPLAVADITFKAFSGPTLVDQILERTAWAWSSNEVEDCLPSTRKSTDAYAEPSLLM
jgi:hypothetical protein